MQPTLSSCPRCGTHPAGRAAELQIEGGCELDGRPLTASAESLSAWLHCCSECGLQVPSLEAMRILVECGRTDQAIAVALESSWIEDGRDEAEADRCREAALWLLRRQANPDPMLAAELARRVGRFDLAQQIALRGRASCSNPAVAAVLDTQAVLARQRDRGRHSMVDALAAAGLG